ncbi:MAG: hypothetical protein GWP08_17140, partial [Nitrospiraceae bacterium]|nr:hypothetical protein [Nitrospiraceae bacterium]
MATWKKIVLGAGILLGSLVIAFVTVVGPWPTYSGGFEGKGYFKKALAAIDENAGESTLTDAPGRLQAGWARASITPKLGTPMAGYSDREGAPSEGVHDELLVKALALGDGEDVVVLVGADMLLVPDNVANLVRAKVAEQTPLTPNDLYFGASHSHCSVGALAPGFMAKVSFGEYDPDIPPFLADAFTKAI